MTTDKQHQILEAAAKACGYEVEAYCDDGTLVVNSEARPYGFNWNPLTTPEDCAIMCAELLIDWLNNWNNTVDGVIAMSIEWDTEALLKDHDNSRLKAWMYAATMVAAKIGGMK